MSKIKQLIKKAIALSDSIEYTETNRKECNVLDNITLILLEIEKTYDEMWEHKDAN